jgi:endonuclease/exonuclease/phosphatase family metal-dependent hydrolase
MRVVTYNIHKGIGGVDRQYQIDRVIDVLRHQHADVMLLQEVDHDARRSAYHHQSELLAEALDMPHMAVGINHRLRRGGGYGNVTLSRFPIAESFNLDLTQPRRKRRGALFTLVDHPDFGALRVFNFHLGLVHHERRHQVRRMLQCDPIASDGSAPAIIAGDSNDWGGRLCRRMLAPCGFDEAAIALRGRRARTFPAFFPVVSLDRFYYRSLRVTSLGLGEHPHAGRASDHLPVFVDLAGQEAQEPKTR